MEKQIFAKKPLFILAAVLIAIAVLSNTPAESNWNQKQINMITHKENFCFSVVSDIHNNKPSFDNFLMIVNTSDSFILVNGDFIHRGTNEEYFSAVASFKESKLPIVVGIGNHELWAGSSMMFKKTFGQTYFSFNVSKNLFIVLDNSRDAIDVDQYEWLKKELDRPYEQKFVFMHESILSENGTYLTGDAKILENLFISKQVDLVVASHEHKYSNFIRKDIHYVITGSCGGVGDKDPSYVEICITNNTINVEKFGLGTQSSIEQRLNTEILPVFSISYRILLLTVFCYIAVDVIRRNMEK